MKVMPDEAWMTAAERAAWDKLADAARFILRLQPVHPSEQDEAVRDIHDLQCRLLARAAYPRAVRESGVPTEDARTARDRSRA